MILLAVRPRVAFFQNNGWSIQILGQGVSCLKRRNNSAHFSVSA